MGIQVRDSADDSPLVLPAAAWTTGIGTAALGVLALIGWPCDSRLLAYGERRLYAPDAQIGMALNTALGLTTMSVGLLATIPDGVLARLFRRPAPGALLSRRLLPWVTIVMPVIGWLRVEGERRGLFGSPLGTAIMVFAGSFFILATARLAVRSMDRLSSSLNHAWHQYGLVSANEHIRMDEERVRSDW